MPICQKCGKEWTWKQTMKTSFRLKCPLCGTKQFETASSRKRMSLFSLLPLIALPINVLLNLSWWLVVVSMIPLIVVILFIYPFILKLSNEEEPLW